MLERYRGLGARLGYRHTVLVFGRRLFLVMSSGNIDHLCRFVACSQDCATNVWRAGVQKGCPDTYLTSNSPSTVRVRTPFLTTWLVKWLGTPPFLKRANRMARFILVTISSRLAGSCVWVQSVGGLSRVSTVDIPHACMTLPSVSNFSRDNTYYMSYMCR